MESFWQKQIERADHLAEESSGSQELLAFYSQLLRAQEKIYESLRSQKDWSPAGDVETDIPIIQTLWHGLLETVALHGPTSLAADAHLLLVADPEIVAEKLFDYWHSSADTQFFGKAILQPYAYWLAEMKITPAGRELTNGERVCPFCGGAPQLSFLLARESNAESGNRDLLCATCLHAWEFRRVVCANCGEERPDKLGYFHSPEFDHIRLEACDTCKHYVKGIDLTRVGLAVPTVDEIYGAPLDLWAHAHGYKKIELNLIGL